MMPAIRAVSTQIRPPGGRASTAVDVARAPDRAAGLGHPPGHRFAGHVDHVGPAVLVDVGEAGSRGLPPGEGDVIRRTPEAGRRVRPRRRARGPGRPPRRSPTGGIPPRPRRTTDRIGVSPRRAPRATDVPGTSVRPVPAARAGRIRTGGARAPGLARRSSTWSGPAGGIRARRSRARTLPPHGTTQLQGDRPRPVRPSGRRRRTSSSSSLNRQFRTAPSAVSRSRLHVPQNGWVTLEMTPISPWPSTEPVPLGRGPVVAPLRPPPAASVSRSAAPPRHPARADRAARCPVASSGMNSMNRTMRPVARANAAKSRISSSLDPDSRTTFTFTGGRPAASAASMDAEHGGQVATPADGREPLGTQRVTADVHPRQPGGDEGREQRVTAACRWSSATDRRTRGRPDRPTSRSRPRRTSGSPPVRRTASTPSERATRGDPDDLVEGEEGRAGEEGHALFRHAVGAP